MTGDLDEEDMDEENEHESEHSRHKRKVTSMPSPGITHTIFYRGHWLKITPIRSYQDFGDYSGLKISVIAHKNNILKRLVLEAKGEYEKDVEHRVHNFTADAQHACWGWNGTRRKRPMSSIVLKPTVKEKLLADCRDFLRSKDWYAERGIPFRRGYLLHGVPRSGKTSLINSLAGELGLDICSLILSSKGMCDNTLMKLMRNVPSRRCILLLEDLDATFTCGIASTGDSAVPTRAVVEGNGGSALSLSGLLTSLDWMDPAEGRLLFVTINQVERLDPALSRPGRMDVWINFTHATKWQAEGIFTCFFLPRPSSSSPDEARFIGSLARSFADAIPEGEISVASLEGYLLKYKTRPRECVEEVTAWVEQERMARGLFQG